MSWPDGVGVVELPDGRRVRGRSLRSPVPLPASTSLGVRQDTSTGTRNGSGGLTSGHRPTGIPPSTCFNDGYTRALTDRVEIACNGGTGRTGTAIAILAVLAGVPPDDAVAWVRTNYRRRAVETPWQRRWATSVGTSR